MANKAGVTLDTVLIQIESDAGKSAGNIDKLAASLSNLKAAVSGGYNPISRLADNLKKLDDNTKNISAISARLKNVGKLAEYVEPLQNIGSMNRLSKAGTNIKNLASSINNLNTKGLVNASKLAEQVESLQTIGAMNNLSKAGDNIRKLSEDAKSIGSLVGRLEGVGAVAEYIQPLQNIGSTKKLATAGENIKKLDNNTQNVPNLINRLSGIGKLAEYLQPLKDIGSTTGLGNAADNIGKISSTMESITPDALENVGRVSAELSSKLSPLAAKLHEIASGYNAISNLAKNYNVSIKTITSGHNSLLGSSKTLVSIFNKLGNAVKLTSRWFAGMIRFGKNTTTSIAKPITKVTSKIKQMGFALLSVRSAFTFVRKAIDEYMQMDSELQSSIQNTWRAMGAQLAPVVEYVTNLFHQFVRVIYSIILALTGIDLISRANDKAMKNWGKSTKDTLGSLQKFDDLNVVDFGKGSGDENKLIEMDTIDLSPIQKLLELVKKIKEELKSAFDTGEWAGVGTAVADLLNYSFSKIKTADIKKMLKKFAKPINDTLNSLIKKIRWSDFGSAISNVFVSVMDSISSFIANIDFKTFGVGLVDGLLSFNPSAVLDSWSRIWNSLFKSVNELSYGLNEKWDEIKLEAEQVGVSLGNYFNDIVHKIDWDSLTKNVTEGLNTILSLSLKAIETFDFGGLGETLGNIINTFFKDFDFEKLSSSITKLLSGLLQSLSSLVSTIDWYTIGEKIVIAILDVDWAQLSVDLLDFVENLWIALLDAARGIGATLGEFIWALFGGEKQTQEDARTFGEKWADAWNQGMVERMQYHIKSKGDNSIFGTFAFLKGLIKGWFGIASPSKWAKEEIGENITQGFANGLSGLWDKTKGYFTTFVNGVIELINKMIYRINNNLKISVGSTLSTVLSALGVDVKNGHYQLFSIPTIPKLETGTNEIPYEGIYHLHPGEAVVPKKYNPAIGGNNTSEETNRKLDTIAYLLENMSVTNTVNIGNETLYKKQQRFNKMQNDKYGTTVNL